MDSFTIRRFEKILDGYIAWKVPHHVRSSVRLTYQWEGNRLTLCEERPDFYDRRWGRAAIVQFRLEQEKWHVYARGDDHDWQIVASITPHADFERQLEQVERDREGIFWIS